VITSLKHSLKGLSSGVIRAVALLEFWGVQVPKKSVGLGGIRAAEEAARRQNVAAVSKHADSGRSLALDYWLSMGLNEVVAF